MLKNILKARNGNRENPDSLWKSTATWIWKEGITPTKSMDWSSSKRNGKFGWWTRNEVRTSLSLSSENKSRSRRMTIYMPWRGKLHSKICSVKYLCGNRGIKVLWADYWSRFKTERIKRIHLQKKKNFKILKQRAAQRYRTFLANPWLSRVREKCLAAIRDCRLWHRIPKVILDTSLRAQQLKKDLPQLSSETRELLFSRIRVLNLR